MVPPKGTTSLTAQELNVAKIIKDFQKPRAGGEVRFSISGDLQSEDGERVSLEDVEKNGIVTHGLKRSLCRHCRCRATDFSETGNEAIQKAKEWANNNIVGEHTVKQIQLILFIQ